MMKTSSIAVTEKENRGALLSPSGKGRKGLQQTTNQAQPVATMATKVAQPKSSIPVPVAPSVAKNSIPLRTVKTKREKEEEERKEKTVGGGSTANVIKAKPPPDWSKIHAKEEEKKAEKLAKLKAQQQPVEKDVSDAQRGQRRPYRSDGSEEGASQAPPMKQSRPQLHGGFSREDFSSDSSALQSILSDTGIQDPTIVGSAYRNTLAAGALLRQAPATTSQNLDVHEQELLASNAYIQNLRIKQRASMYVRSQTTTTNQFAGQSQPTTTFARTLDPAQLQWAGPRAATSFSAQAVPQQAGAIKYIPNFQQQQQQQQQQMSLAPDAPATPVGHGSEHQSSRLGDMSAKKLAAIPLPSERGRRQAAPLAADLFGQQAEEFSSNAQALFREMPAQANQRRATLSLAPARAKLFSTSTEATTQAQSAAAQPAQPAASHLSVPTQKPATSLTRQMSSLLHQKVGACADEEFFSASTANGAPDAFLSEENVASMFNKMEHPTGLGETIQADKTKRASIYHGALRVAKKKTTTGTVTTPGKDNTKELLYLAKMTPASGMQRLTLAATLTEASTNFQNAGKAPMIGTPASRVTKSVLQKTFDRELDFAAQSPSILSSHKAVNSSAAYAGVMPVKVAWEDEQDVFEAPIEHGRLSGDLARARLEAVRAQELALMRELEEDIEREEALAQAEKSKIEAIKGGFARPSSALQQHQQVSSFRRPEASLPTAAPAPAPQVVRPEPVVPAGVRPVFRDSLRHGCGEDGCCSNDLHPELASIHLSIFSNAKSGGLRCLDNPLADIFHGLESEAVKVETTKVQNAFIPITATTLSTSTSSASFAVSPLKVATSSASAFKRNTSAFLSIR